MDGTEAQGDQVTELRQLMSARAGAGADLSAFWYLLSQRAENVMLSKGP